MKGKLTKYLYDDRISDEQFLVKLESLFKGGLDPNIHERESTGILDDMSDEYSLETLLGETLSELSYKRPNVMAATLDLFVKHGYDGKKLGFWTLYDSYLALIGGDYQTLECVIDKLLDQKPENDNKKQWDQLVDNIQFDSVHRRISVEDYKSASYAWAFAQKIERYLEGRDYRQVKFYGHIIGKKIERVTIKGKNIINQENDLIIEDLELVIKTKDNQMITDGFNLMIDNESPKIKGGSSNSRIESTINKHISGKKLLEIWLDTQTTRALQNDPVDRGNTPTVSFKTPIFIFVFEDGHRLILRADESHRFAKLHITTRFSECNGMWLRHESSSDCFDGLHTLSRYPSDIKDIFNLLAGFDYRDFPILGSIDYYGYTFAQYPILLKRELENLIERYQSRLRTEGIERDDITRQMGELLAYIDRCINDGGAHTILVFDGV